MNSCLDNVGEVDFFDNHSNLSTADRVVYTGINLGPNSGLDE